MIKDLTKIFLIFLSFFLAFYFEEDSLGGGKHDYLYHIKFLNLFAENFFLGFENFGIDQEKMAVRNSPIFYMMMSPLIKIDFSLSQLRFINFFSVIIILVFFIKSFNLKFPNTTLNTKILFSAILLLSPTVRTLAVWPYPIIWALGFFLISIYYFLKFLEERNINHQLKYAAYNIIFLAVSAYFTPNFSVFSIFFLFQFFLKFNFSKNFLKCIILNIVLSIPAILFLITKDFYLLKSDVFEIDNQLKYNLFNKVVIISTVVFLFYLPFIDYFNINKKFKKFNFFDWKFYILIFFIILNIYFFNFTPKAGGGIFFHVSYFLFKNNTLIYVIFFISLLFFYISNLYNKSNLILFFLLIIYNLQYSIYYKYFDPLLYILILFMFKINNEEIVRLEKLKNNLFVFYIIFLGLNLLKKTIEY